jgi:cytochrome c553
MKSASDRTRRRFRLTMNLLERIPTSWLLTGAAFACLLLWAGPGWAQDATIGKRLFEDTPNESGVATLGTCTNCHTLANRRDTISQGGGAFADISFDRAMTRFGTAIGGNFGGAMGQFNQLGSDNIQHIAAYLADTPKLASTDLVDNGSSKVLPFVASASGVSVTKNITISHSVAPSNNANLTINSVTISAGSTGFTRSSACNGAVRAPGGTCTFSVTFLPTGTTATLNGSVQGATPPPPAQPPAADDGGGGALGLAWLAGLAAAVVALAWRRREV